MLELSNYMIFIVNVNMMAVRTCKVFILKFCLEMLLEILDNSY
jgi:hypothetical protein